MDFKPGDLVRVLYRPRQLEYNWTFRTEEHNGSHFVDIDPNEIVNGVFEFIREDDHLCVLWIPTHKVYGIFGKDSLEFFNKKEK